MSLFPLDETDLPRRDMMVAVSLGFGASTCMLANLIHNLPFYHRPLQILFGGAVGAIVGYALHNESTRAWRDMNARKEHKLKLAQQYLRDNGSEMSEEERRKWTSAIQQRQSQTSP